MSESLIQRENQIWRRAKNKEHLTLSTQVEQAIVVRTLSLTIQSAKASKSARGNYNPSSVLILVCIVEIILSNNWFAGDFREGHNLASKCIKSEEIDNLERINFSYKCKYLVRTGMLYKQSCSQ